MKHIIALVITFAAITATTAIHAQDESQKVFLPLIILDPTDTPPPTPTNTPEPPTPTPLLPTPIPQPPTPDPLVWRALFVDNPPGTGDHVLVEDLPVGAVQSYYLYHVPRTGQHVDQRFNYTLKSDIYSEKYQLHLLMSSDESVVVTAKLLLNQQEIATHSFEMNSRTLIPYNVVFDGINPLAVPGDILTLVISINANNGRTSLASARIFGNGDIATHSHIAVALDPF